MSIATLSEVLSPALEKGYAVAGLVTLGWEDMRAYVEAAEEEGVPLILQAGPGCREHTPLPILGKMFQHLAQQATVPVVAHLDHGYSMEECREAIDCGFTSVMYDGSRKPLAQNIDETAAIVQIAHAAGVSCEGEIGFVGYDGGEASDGTDPDEAAEFAKATAVDAMAISVGNVHLQQDQVGLLDEDRIALIDQKTRAVTGQVPLVIHGGSGVPATQRVSLARSSAICKYNIGTELRQVFGHALRESVNKDQERFDRNAILKDTHVPMVAAARQVLQHLGHPSTR